jgi:hypothetical protein
MYIYNQLRKVVYQYRLRRDLVFPLVKVDGLWADGVNLEGAERVAGGDLLSIDVGDTEVRLGLLLGVDNGHDSESVFDAELRAVTPGDVDGRACGAGKVGPRLCGGILHVEAHDCAALNRPVVARGEVEVVVTAGLVLSAVAAQVLDGPGQSIGLGLAAGRSSSGYSFDSAAGGLGSLDGGRRGN